MTEPLTGETLMLAAALRESKDSSLWIGSIVDNAIEVELFGDAAQPTATLLALGAYVLNLRALRLLHIKVW